MGQSTSVEQRDIAKRAESCMKSYREFNLHLEEANEWADLCNTPKNCRLEFRSILNANVKPEFLPYIWKASKNVQVEVRKVRRGTEPSGESTVSKNAPDVWDGSEDTIGIGLLQWGKCAALLFMVLDIRDCTAHSLAPPSGPSDDDDSKLMNDIDDLECQVCMDNQKEVVLPCSHSFCLSCFKSWSSQHKTCPICRSVVRCEEGEELWQLTFNEAKDLQSYTNDLVARIYEQYEKLEPVNLLGSESEPNLKLNETLMAIRYRMFPPTEAENGNAAEDDYKYCLSLVSLDEQVAAEQQILIMQRDQEMAEMLSYEIDDP